MQPKRAKRKSFDKSTNDFGDISLITKIYKVNYTFDINLKVV